MYNPNESYKYKVIRGKKEYIDPRIDKLKSNGNTTIDTLDNVQLFYKNF